MWNKFTAPITPQRGIDFFDFFKIFDENKSIFPDSYKVISLVPDVISKMPEKALIKMQDASLISDGKGWPSKSVSSQTAPEIR